MKRLLFQLFCTLIIVGLLLHFIWWIIFAALAVWLGREMWRSHLRSQAAKAALIAHADSQHQQVMQGNPAGMYGAGWDARQDYERETRR